MKKLLFTSLLAGLFLTACNGDGAKEDGKEEASGPEVNVEKYLKAFHSMEFEEAKEFATKETAELLEMMKQMQGMMSESDMEKAKKTKIKNVSCGEVKEETCECTFEISAEGTSSEETIEAKKVDGEWLAHQTKDGEMQKASQEVDMGDVDASMEEIEEAVEDIDGEEIMEEAEEVVDEAEKEIEEMKK